MQAVFGDPDVMRFSGGGARSPAGTLERVRGLIEHQERHGFSKWGVEERGLGRLVGDCGIQLLEGGPDVELGFHLRRSAWGRGYATEAARACLDSAFTGLGLAQVVAIVAPGNAASVRVLEKIGMRAAGEREALGRTWELFIARGRPIPERRGAAARP
jgi:[ribosomal protein S5]-alanine N-acetyltransferase